jgi:hypothetical protein
MAYRKRVSDGDGGCHAIKGFAFQFDATILEVLAKPEAVVGIEGDQDLNIENFHIQVKMRSQTFSHSKIAKAVKQLISQFARNTDRHYRLYCHFTDQAPGTVVQLDDKKLDEILGTDIVAYTQETKKLFADRFEIRFAPDFETQFSTVLDQLKSRHGLNNTEEAVVYHAILNQALTALVLSKPAGSRTVTAAQLDLAVRNAEQVIFRGGYQDHLGVQKYISLLRSQIPPSRSVNMPWRERLVIAELDSGCDVHDAIDFAIAASNRFYIEEISPQPYLLLRGSGRILSFKQELWDADVRFADGTHFHGDRFRIADLISRPPKAIRLKLLEEGRLAELLAAKQPREVYEFYCTRPLTESFTGSRLRRMPVDSLADAVKIMEVTGRK